VFESIEGPSLHEIWTVHNVQLSFGRTLRRCLRVQSSGEHFVAECHYGGGQFSFSDFVFDIIARSSGLVGIRCHNNGVVRTLDPALHGSTYRIVRQEPAETRESATSCSDWTSVAFRIAPPWTRKDDALGLRKPMKD
jgi:hypothetical protein